MAGIDLRQERYESGFEMINEYRVPSSSKRSGGASDFLANNRFILLILFRRLRPLLAGKLGHAYRRTRRATSYRS